MEKSLLANLSPEIRNHIYLHTFHNPTHAVPLQHNAILHPLTLTCRQIRHETLGMYLSLTSLNAYLNDGPIYPLARWLQALGPERCLLLREVNVWDMHMLNGTFHGTEVATGMLEHGTEGEGVRYVLRPVGRQVFHRSWYLKDIILALQSIGLGLARFCIVEDDDGGVEVKETSRFAIMPSMEIGGLEGSAALAQEFGLDDRERSSLVAQLEKGRREIRILDGRRNIVLRFDSGYRLCSMAQEFIPRDEEFYLEGDSVGVLGRDRMT